MLKGLKKIDTYLNNWLHENGFDCTVRLGSDFGYIESKDIIEYAFVIPEHSNKLFMEACKSYDKDFIECEPFIISFFHELGHYETQGVFSEKEWSQYDKLLNNINIKDKISDKDYKRYYYNPIEYEATIWAIDYINQHQDKIIEWWNNLQPLIIEFYKLNNIVNE